MTSASLVIMNILICLLNGVIRKRRFIIYWRIMTLVGLVLLIMTYTVTPLIMNFLNTGYALQGFVMTIISYETYKRS